jgi:hypothetical protein
MNYAKAIEMASEIVRLVTDLEHEFAKQIVADGSKKSPDGLYFGRQLNYRNWNDTVANALPTRSFTEALWADVFGVPIGRAPVMSSKLVDAFVNKWRVEIAEWEFIGNVGD